MLRRFAGLLRSALRRIDSSTNRIFNICEDAALAPRGCR